MNRYKITVCTESVLVVEAHSASGAEEKALQLSWSSTGCFEGLQSSTVTGVVNLSDPIGLVADLCRQLQRFTFEDGICRFCGGVPDAHAEGCIISRALYFLEKSDLPGEERHERE